ncbi:MAG: iron ABC transporter permease [Firmicutes bacterium]|nr:iron ABC transporter permease [Bacillota bacterium]
MALLPAATALILSGLLPIEENMVASGQVLAKDPKVWWRIVLPTAAPQIISTTGLIFLLSFCDYTIPSLFSINVYAVEPFVEYSSSYNVFRALFTSLPLLVPSVFVFFFSMKNVRKLFLMKREQYVLKSLFQWGLPLRLIQVTSFFILISGAAVLLIVMLFNIEVFKQVPMVISSSTSDIAYTLMISLLASLISLVLCALAAKALNELKNPGILWSIILLPFAIPAPLVGTAIIALFNHPIKLMQFLYNSMLMPVLACTVRFSPVGVLIFSSYLVRLDYSAIEAAGILSGNRIRILFNISFPMLMPAFILTFLSVFFLSIGELGATVMLLPPGMGTLTLKIYNYLHYGANERVMALCLIIVSIVMLPGLLIVILSSKSKKRSGCGFD